MRGIILTENPGRPVVVCTCGEAAEGVAGQLWSVSVTADGKRATVTPSLDWGGHFHTGNPAADVPVIEYTDLGPAP